MIGRVLYTYKNVLTKRYSHFYPFHATRFQPILLVSRPTLRRIQHRRPDKNYSVSQRPENRDDRIFRSNAHAIVVLHTPRARITCWYARYGPSYYSGNRFRVTSVSGPTTAVLIGVRKKRPDRRRYACELRGCVFSWRVCRRERYRHRDGSSRRLIAVETNLLYRMYRRYRGRVWPGIYIYIYIRIWCVYPRFDVKRPCDPY